jgi:hypothetical protein
MKIITTNEQFEKEVLRLSRQNPSFFYISTFNLRVDKFLDTVLRNLPKKCDKKFLIGVLNTTSKKKINFIKSYLFERRIAFKIIVNHHTKLILTDKSGIVGGRNITASLWNDLDMVVQKSADINKLKRYFNSLYTKSKKL